MVATDWRTQAEASKVVEMKCRGWDVVPRGRSGVWRGLATGSGQWSPSRWAPRGPEAGGICGGCLEQAWGLAARMEEGGGARWAVRVRGQVLW